MKSNVVQVHNVNIEEFKSEILNGLEKTLENFKESLKPKRPNKYITRKELAALLQVSLVTTYEWEKKGILHPMRIGNRVRFELSEIEKILSESR